MSEGHKYQDHLIATLIETLHYFNLHKHELENILEIMIPKHVNLAFYPLALNLLPFTFILIKQKKINKIGLFCDYERKR